MMNYQKFGCLVLISLVSLVSLIQGTPALTVDDSEVFIVEAPENTVYFIYSDITQRSKPLEVCGANSIDWTATGYIRGLTQNPQLEGLDTDSSLVDPITGAPVFSDKSIVLSGGPVVQVLVKYYEENRIAPVYFKYTGGKNYWFLKNGTRLDSTGMIPTDHEDMFLIEHFLDRKGNAVLIIYGYGGMGTFAGARFFKAIIHPNIRDYTHSYYIYHWVDSNNDCFPDLNEINTIPLAYGD